MSDVDEKKARDNVYACFFLKPNRRRLRPIHHQTFSILLKRDMGVVGEATRRSSIEQQIMQDAKILNALLLQTDPDSSEELFKQYFNCSTLSC